jgi:hypothetical protein
VTRAFYEQHGDDYDFVVVWTDFVVVDFWQFAIATRVDIAGIGQDVVYNDLYQWDLDYWKEAGSAGRLQAAVFMNGKGLFSMSAFTAQELLTHEVAHRWGATLVLPSLADPYQLVDEYWSHWPIVVGGGASALGYGETVDLGGGQFENHVVTPLRYSPLELYIMGLLPPDAPELGDLFWVAGPHSFQPPQNVLGQPWTKDSLSAKTPLTFQGTRVDLSVGEIVADLGPRSPAHADAQKHFRFAFVLVCPPQRPCSDEGLAWVDAQRSLWEGTFPTATGQRATADTKL